MTATVTKIGTEIEIEIAINEDMVMIMTGIVMIRRDTRRTKVIPGSLMTLPLHG
jgi:hypothetical protein